MKETIKKAFWKIPIPLSWKIKLRSLLPQAKETSVMTGCKSIVSLDREIIEDYCSAVLNIPTYKSEYYQDYRAHDKNTKRKALVCAYYLTQYHPTEKNNLWWGKGTTEWTNVSKAVPQYPGHYQPRLPGELGYYDLRLPENMYRQIELAQNYGVDAFAFYYYWFNGERALELPFETFIAHKDMKQQYCLCWCNEDWTKRYSGTSSEVLLSVGKSQDSYMRFIESIIPYFLDERYLKIDGKLVLIIYRPSEVPDCEKTLRMWRKIVKEKTNYDLYLIASQERRITADWLSKGFDANSQFQPASVIDDAKEITREKNTLRSDFEGHIYDYEQVAKKAIDNVKKVKRSYPAVMPMWDNTSRRNNCPNIFEGSTPHLYQKWLEEAIQYVNENMELDNPMVLINAWNEWGEGAYLEPDRAYGYAYLEATYKANCELK